MYKMQLDERERNNIIDCANVKANIVHFIY